MSRFYIDTQTIPWEQISRPKVEAVVFRPQTKIYQAPRFNDMDKMHALQSRARLRQPSFYLQTLI
jgi:hypothetical protein